MIGNIIVGIIIFLIGFIVGGRIRHQAIIMELHDILVAHRHDFPRDPIATLDDIIFMLIGERVE